MFIHALTVCFYLTYCALQLSFHTSHLNVYMMSPGFVYSVPISVDILIFFKTKKKQTRDIMTRFFLCMYAKLSW
ncbi:hypothetical protein KSF78_0008395 [Schistosoma japonicum]|nr:hypothetical protein KSF78_0008395 [Schistosoma japonicum]KAH8874507.1 hypothetical protein KSF78_0008395 [Schistosoma japonicum]